MRPLCAIGLLVAGCSTDPTYSPPSPSTPTAPPGAATGTAAALQPQVCGAHAWTTLAATADSLSLAVASLPVGAALFTVPRSGGPVSGFAIDSAGNQLGSPAGQQLAAGKFVSVRATYADSQLVVAPSDGQNTQLDLVDLDVTQATPIAKLAGHFIGDAPIVRVRGGNVAPSASSDGVFVSKFDSSWTESSSSLAIASPVSGFDAQPFGDDTMLAWSTADSCYVAHVALDSVSTRPLPCANPRLATDPANSRGLLLFERDGAVFASQIMMSQQDEIATTIALADHARSPRVVYDGFNFWLSYLDQRGDVVIGMVDGEGQLWRHALDNFRPDADSYQLTLVGGEPWVFAVNSTEYVAFQLCKG